MAFGACFGSTLKTILFFPKLVWKSAKPAQTTHGPQTPRIEGFGFPLHRIRSQGGAHVWSSKGVRVAAPRGINHWYSGALGCVQHRLDIGLAYWSKCWSWLGFTASLPLMPFALALGALPVGLYYPRRLVFDDVLDHRCRLPMFEEWVALRATGHTSHQVVLYHRGTRTLYAADLLVAPRPDRIHSPIPVNFPPLHRRALAELSAHCPVDTLLLAHGGERAVADFPRVAARLVRRLDAGRCVWSVLVQLPTRAVRRVWKAQRTPGHADGEDSSSGR